MFIIMQQERMLTSRKEKMTLSLINLINLTLIQISNETFGYPEEYYC